MEEINYDLISYICQFGDIYDIVNLTRVSRALHENIADNINDIVYMIASKHNNKEFENVEK